VSRFIGSNFAGRSGAWSPNLEVLPIGPDIFNAIGWMPMDYSRDPDRQTYLGEWPFSRMVSGADVSVDPRYLVNRQSWCGSRLPLTGHKNGWTYYIKGQVLNESGVPLTAWVSLRVYYSATEALLYELEADGLRDPVVDTEGRFMLGVPDNTSQFYIVVHTVGPERAGSSSRTLTGSLPT
jgi:hypothetical protein